MKVIFLFFCVSFSFAQQIEVVDFKTAKIDVSVNPYQKTIKGNVNYTFDMLQKTDSIYLDNRKGVHPITILLNNKEVQYYVDNQKLWVLSNFLPSDNNTLSILYEATPKKTVYFIGWENTEKNQVWTQGQGKYTSHWLPSIDDVNDKIEFDISISFHKDYQVITNGKLLNQEKVNDSIIKWRYDMQHPMSSYLLAFAIGKYDKKVVLSKSGIPLEMNYYKEEESKFEPTYRYTKKIFDYLEKEINVAYPWGNYKQIPVKDFLYAGMENTGTTIFTDALFIDETSFVDKNYVSVNAHELAHQWFGNLITATSGTHHWLQEGFATYYALLAEREVFGEDYYYYQLYKSAKQLKNANSTLLLNPKASSLVFYKKGAWALHRLRELVGDTAFRLSVQQYLEEFKFKSVSTKDFMNIVNQNTTEDLSNYEITWLYDEEFPIAEVNKSLSKNKNISKILNTPTKYCSKSNVYLQQETLKNIALDSNIAINKKNKVYAKAFSNGLKVRQTLSEVIEDIPAKLKTEYESLLTDNSYQTVENALFKLWIQFPKDRIKYLNQTKSIVGFNDKNIRSLWLLLAISTADYEQNLVTQKLEELIDYTAPKYHFEVRKNAFESLQSLRFKNEEVLINLKDATKHHNWRFKKFAIKMLKKIE